MEALTGWWDDFFWGSKVVAEVFIASLGLTILFGLIGAAAKLSNSKIAKKLAAAYTVIFRGTPEILVIQVLFLKLFFAVRATPQLKFLLIDRLYQSKNISHIL